MNNEAEAIIAACHNNDGLLTLAVPAEIDSSSQAPLPTTASSRMPSLDQGLPFGTLNSRTSSTTSQTMLMNEMPMSSPMAPNPEIMSQVLSLIQLVNQEVALTQQLPQLEETTKVEGARTLPVDIIDFDVDSDPFQDPWDAENQDEMFAEIVAMPSLISSQASLLKESINMPMAAGTTRHCPNGCWNINSTANNVRRAMKRARCA